MQMCTGRHHWLSVNVGRGNLPHTVVLSRNSVGHLPRFKVVLPPQYANSFGVCMVFPPLTVKITVPEWFLGL